MEGYEDKSSIRFDDDATSGYDIELEAKKWESQNSDATIIRTIAEDNAQLAINVLPTAKPNKRHDKCTNVLQLWLQYRLYTFILRYGDF